MDEGLKIILENMQNEIHLARQDIRALLENRWRAEGKATVITVAVGAIVTMVFQIVLALIQSKGG